MPKFTQIFEAFNNVPANYYVPYFGILFGGAVNAIKNPADDEHLPEFLVAQRNIPYEFLLKEQRKQMLHINSS